MLPELKRLMENFVAQDGVIVLCIFLVPLAIQAARRSQSLWYYRQWLVGVIIFAGSIFLIKQIVDFFYFYDGPLRRLFFPPHSGYYLEHVSRNLIKFLSGVVAAGVVFGWGVWLTERRKFQAIGTDDVMLLTIGAVAVGWPAVLVYLAVTFALSIVGLLFLIIIRRKTFQDRLIITPYIIPAAILTLFFRIPLLEITKLGKISF